MKRIAWTAIVATVLVLSGAGATATGTPVNDNFADGTVISGLPYTDSTNTQNATLEDGEPRCEGRPFFGGPAYPITDKTVWYRFTPTETRYFVADTYGSSFDTVLAVYTGQSLSTLTSRGCVDDSRSGFQDDSSGWQSEIFFSAQAGTTYHVQVGGYKGAAGTLEFHLSICWDHEPSRIEQWPLEWFGLDPKC